MPVNKQLTDEQLVSAIQRGDQNALLQLYRDNFMAVRNHILKNNGKMEDVEDVLQDATIAVWEKIRNNSLQLNAKLSTFVFAIARNQWLKRLNKMNRMVQMNDIHTEKLTDNPDNLEVRDIHLVKNVMNQLGEKCQKILTLFYFDGMDMNAIADELEYNNADTAKAKKHQCFKQLQELFLNKYNKQDFLGH